MILWIFCIMGWSLFAIMMYLSYRLHKSWTRDYTFVVKDNKDLVIKFNDAALKYNDLLDHIEKGHKITTQPAAVNKNLLN
jgi:hypothetical protein